jgi:hypothetical protein
VRRSETGALAVEIAWLRAAELPKLTRVEDLLAGVAPSPEPARPARPAPAAAPPAARSEVRSPAPAPARSAALAPPVPPPAAPAARTPVPPPATEARPRGQGLNEQDQIQAFLEEVKKRRQPLAALLEEADLAFADGSLHIASPPDDGLLEMRLQQPASRQTVEEAVAAVWGAGTAWRLVRGGGTRKAAPAAASPAEPAPETARVNELPQVQALLDIFGGRIENVEEHGRSREESTR